MGTLHPALRPLVQHARTRSSCIFLLVTAFFALDIRMRTQVCSTKIASDAAIDFSYSRCFRMFSSKIGTEIKSDKIGIPCRPARSCSYFSLSCVLISGSHVQLQSSTHRAGECRQSVLRALLPTERATRVDSALSLGALKRNASIPHCWRTSAIRVAPCPLSAPLSARFFEAMHCLHALRSLARTERNAEG